MNRLFLQTRHTDGQRAHEKMFNITNHQSNANQNHNEVSRQLEWLFLSRQEITSVGEDMEKREHSYPVDGNVNSCSH